jgi:hypothetical protein
LYAPEGGTWPFSEGLLRQRRLKLFCDHLFGAGTRPFPEASARRELRTICASLGVIPGGQEDEKEKTTRPKSRRPPPDA